MPVSELKVFFDNLQLSETDAAIGKRLLMEINNRLQFLVDVGLSYLTLDRLSATLSGGESQRISLATSLGSSLVGSLYILDEPSIGLHSRDTDLLIKVLRQLKELGNTVVVVEHDEEIIRAADYIIDIGPKAGRLGGEVVFQGDITRIGDQAFVMTSPLACYMNIKVNTINPPYDPGEIKDGDTIVKGDGYELTNTDLSKLTIATTFIGLERCTGYLEEGVAKVRIELIEN